MDFETITADEFGRRLKGVGVNLLSPDVEKLAAFLKICFDLSIHRLSPDFAIVEHDGVLLQLHADATFSKHPVFSLLPEASPRGAGAQFYLFDVDPDKAVEKATKAGGMVMEAPANKPHGLREATILSPEGYGFSPSIATTG